MNSLLKCIVQSAHVVRDMTQYYVWANSTSRLTTRSISRVIERGVKPQLNKITSAPGLRDSLIVERRFTQTSVLARCWRRAACCRRHAQYGKHTAPRWKARGPRMHHTGTTQHVVVWWVPTEQHRATKYLTWLWYMLMCNKDFVFRGLSIY